MSAEFSYDRALTRIKYLTLRSVWRGLRPCSLRAGE